MMGVTTLPAQLSLRRELVDQYAPDVHDIGAGAFSESGTEVATVVVVLKKPHNDLE